MAKTRVAQVDGMAAEALQEAFRHLAMAAVIATRDGRVICANAEAVRMAPGCTPGAMLTEALPQGDPARLLAAAEERSSVRLVPDEGKVITARPRIAGDFLVLALEHEQAGGSDPLTGLADRGRFRAELQANLARIRRNGTSLALLCLDLDRFKLVNDTLGHPVGDALLCKVADRLRRAVRGEDLVARIGGDEFVVVQTDVRDPNAPEALARRLVELVARDYVVDGHVIDIGVSIGIARAPDDGTEPDALHKSADMALYQAKAVGRGTFCFFDPILDAKLRDRRALECDLRKAMSLKQLHLVFQPQIRIECGAVEGFEALLRWDHPTRGLIPPADFIPIAEEIGMIDPIGDWVLRTACDAAARWPIPVIVAVNISAGQVRRGQLVKSVQAALALSGLPPDRLELEVAEGAIVQDSETVFRVLTELRALGVRLSLDDFGTDYSSLGYLQRFMFDKIKIDGMYVRAINDDPKCRAIIRATTGLGQSLGIATTAEGVETAEQFDQLRADGCSGVQGFLTGAPVTSEEAHALMVRVADLRDAG